MTRDPLQFYSLADERSVRGPPALSFLTCVTNCPGPSAHLFLAGASKCSGLLICREWHTQYWRFSFTPLLTKQNIRAPLYSFFCTDKFGPTPIIFPLSISLISCYLPLTLAIMITFISLDFLNSSVTNGN